MPKNQKKDTTKTLTLEELSHYMTRLIKVCGKEARTNVLTYIVDTTAKPNKITIEIK